MSVKKFPIRTLKDLLLEDGPSDLEVVSDEHVGQGRWSSHHQLVFREKSTGLLWGTTYSKGLTESQDEYPFDYSPDPVECDGMVEKRVTVTTYEKVAK